MKRLCLIAFVLFACSYIAVAQSSTEKDLIALENSFNEALVRADVKTIEGIEADDLIFTDASGMVSNKLDEIRSLKSGDVEFESITMTDTRVQDFGNTAMVTGMLFEKAQYKNTDISGTYRFTDVWAKRKGKWEHVAGQETLLKMPTPAFPSAQSDAADVKARLATLINLQLQYKADAVGKLLDPDFVYVSNDGSVVSRANSSNSQIARRTHSICLKSLTFKCGLQVIRQSQRVSFTKRVCCMASPTTFGVRR